MRRFIIASALAVTAAAVGVFATAGSASASWCC